MSDLKLVQLTQILTEFTDSPYTREICTFFERQFLQKIQNHSITHEDLKILVSYTSFYKSQFHSTPHKLISKFVQKKVVEIRATILDILTDDYHEKVSNFQLRPPDKWMLRVVQEILSVFLNFHDFSFYNSVDQLTLSHSDHEIFTIFLDEFVSDCKDVFISQKKFTRVGNQLVLNFIAFDRVISQVFPQDTRQNIPKDIPQNIQKDISQNIPRNFSQNHHKNLLNSKKTLNNNSHNDINIIQIIHNNILDQERIDLQEISSFLMSILNSK